MSENNTVQLSSLDKLNNKFTTKNGRIWEGGSDYPLWMNEAGLVTLDNGYLLSHETPRDAMYRVARRAGEILNMGHIVEPIFESIWKRWICLSTPVWCNFGAPRALPISCFGVEIADSIKSIYESATEIATMTQMGGGTSGYAGNIRPRGSAISGGGVTNGSKAFAAPFDTTISVVTQGESRRGSMAWYLPFKHKDINEHLQIKNVGDPIQNLFPGVCISAQDVEDIYNGDPQALDTWSRILDLKNKTGLPYLFFTHNANNHLSTPPWYGGKSDYEIKYSNLCTEIMLPTNLEESFVCCLLSMNIELFQEWKDTKAVRGAIYLLEAIMEDFIQKTKDNIHMKRAHEFAKNHRALGLGVLGWHAYLQSNNQPYAGLFANSSINIVFRHIQEQANRASEKLADIFGNCPVVDKYNRETGANIKARHTTKMAIAPTVGNATIVNTSPGRDAIPSNYYLQKAAKGNFIVKNERLERLLIEKYQKNTADVWISIKENSGSVQHFDWMDEDDKEVYRTAAEINQFDLVKQTALMQNYVDQGISLNVTIPPTTDPKVISSLYLMGYELGIKSFYYQRSENILRKGLNTMDADNCASCSG